MNCMHRRLMPLGAGLLAVSAACAQAAGVELYGTIDLAVGQQEAQPPGPPNTAIVRTRGVHNGAVQTSYLGLRGAEDLGSGWKAKFQLESFLRADTGAAGRFGPPGPPQDPFFSRAAFVGVEGRLGEVRLGLTPNPAWLAMIFTSAMGSNSLFSPSFRQQYNGSTRGYMGLDTALPNSMSYTTPRLGGATAMLSVMAGEGRGSGPNVVGNVVYRSGRWLLAAGLARAEHVPPPDAAAALDQRVALIGGRYDLSWVQLFAQYTAFDDRLTGLKVKTPHIGLTAPLGTGVLQLASARAKDSGSSTATRTTTSLGYHHPLSRRTILYAIVSSDRLPVGTAQSWMTGIKHAF